MKRMRPEDIIGVALIIIIVTAVAALTAWILLGRANAAAYSVRQKANAEVLAVIVRLPGASHHVTISRDGVMSVAPHENVIKLTPETTDADNIYQVGIGKPDSTERRNLLKIVQFSTPKNSGVIASEPRCARGINIAGQTWQNAIDYGRNYGIKTTPGEGTYVSEPYRTIEALEKAINRCDTITPLLGMG